MAKQYFKLEDLVFAEQPKNAMAKNLTGKTFNRLTVLGYAGYSGKVPSWFCECSCEQKRIIKTSRAKLVSGHTSSCGCISSEKTSKRNKTHGMSRSPEYKAFCEARNRCNNPNYKDYHNYGGRGIKMLLTFQEFYDEIGSRPTEKHSVDRINNNANYERGNIRWATKKEQSNNQRTNKIITLNGESKTFAEWTGGYTTSFYKKAHNRLRKGKWCESCAILDLENCIHRKRV
jgi:hypothetical protein